MIEGFDRRQFGKRLNEVVSPSRPIFSIENLLGRSRELDRIEKALMAPGRNVFIFGERGVGKSSLAATAANQWQSSDSGYIDISCSPDSTVSSIIESIASQATSKAWLNSDRKTVQTSIGFKWLSVSVKHERLPLSIAGSVRNLSDAIEVLREVSLLHSDSPIVVVDEVDRMENDEEIDKLADLLKQIGDKQVPIKFIFTGVGTALNEILGSHHSDIRQLETIELPRLSWDARWDIAISALAQFNVSIDRDIYIRLAAVSDGYPYYVHLIVEKLLWILYEREDMVSRVEWSDYYAALDEAILSISAELARPYEAATNQRTQDYEEVLWSTSVDEWQGAYLSSMFESYKKIMAQCHEKTALKYDQYSARIRNLLKPTHGPILVKGNKAGYYHYKEKMLRGYIRMQAEANRIEIVSEEARATIKTLIHVPAKSVGYYKSSAPKRLG